MLVDAVVLAALTSSELADVLRRIDPTDDGQVVHSTASAGTTGHGVLSPFCSRKASGPRFLSTGGLLLAPGVIYESESVIDIAVPGTPPMPMFRAPRIRVLGGTPPETLLATMPGMHVSTIIDHVALRHPDLVVEHVETRDTMVLGGIAKGAQGLVPEYDVVVPQILIDIG